MAEDESNPCKCATLSTGPTKATANSFRFQVCNSDEYVGIPADEIADYIISVIYGDEFGNPPSGGCYNVCFDSGGNRSVALVSEPEAAPVSYDLQEQKTIWPIGEVDPDAYEIWGNATTRQLALIQPPNGYVPTHVRLRIWVYVNDSVPPVVLRDANSNRFFHLQAFDSDDDHSGYAEVSIPVQLNGSNEYEVYITGTSMSSTIIKQIGYEQRGTFDSDGNIVDTVGGTNPEEGEGVVSTTPLNISYINHTYNAVGNDVTVIEWYIDDTLILGDTYSVVFDLGDTIHTEVVAHVVGSSTKQRLTVNWTTENTVKIDAIITQGGSSGNPATSNFGSSDVSIPISFEKTVNV